MSEEFEISKEDRELMIRYNVDAETKVVFYYEGYKYDNLRDAIRYAELSAERE